jgi:hypothetical protein
MKPFLLTLLLLIAAASATALISFRLTGDPGVRTALAHGDAMEWLRAEFQLSDEQFARIRELHAGYADECEQHCLAIQQAMKARKAAQAAGADADTLAAAEQRVQELRTVCETAIAAHARRCAALMSPPAGERYLAMILPKIADFDHQAPPDVRLNSHQH